MCKLFVFYMLFHHNLIFFLGLREYIKVFISASVIGIIFVLGNFPGNEYFNIEITSPFVHLIFQ